MNRCIIIYNPISGKGKFHEQLPDVRRHFTEMNYSVEAYASEYPLHAIQLARKTAEKDPELMVIVGGDGTFNECINGILQTGNRPRIGYIPTGTSCDVANTLGISKNIEKTLRTIDKGFTVAMDVVKTGDGYFSYVAAIGNYVHISYSTSDRLKERIGYFAYILSGIKQFFKLKRYHMELSHPRGSEKRDVSLVMLVNSKRVAGFNMINRPVLDDGKFDIIIYPFVPFLNNILLGLSFLISPKWVPGVVKTKAESAKISVTSGQWTIDGEEGKEGYMQAEVQKKAIDIIIHPKKKRLFKDAR